MEATYIYENTWIASAEYPEIPCLINKGKFYVEAKTFIELKYGIQVLVCNIIKNKNVLVIFCGENALINVNILNKLPEGTKVTCEDGYLCVYIPIEIIDIDNVINV